MSTLSLAEAYPGMTVDSRALLWTLGLCFLPCCLWFEHVLAPESLP